MDLRERFPFKKEDFADKQPWDPTITGDQKVAFLMTMIRPERGKKLNDLMMAARNHGDGKYRITEIAFAASIGVVFPNIYDMMVKDAKAATEGEDNAISRYIMEDLKDMLQH